MGKLDSLRRWRDNPANPKNIQIPFALLIGMEWVLEDMEKILQNQPSGTKEASEDDRAFYAFLLQEIKEKKAKIRNRQEYANVVKAPKGEKQAALDNYHNAKKLGAW